MSVPALLGVAAGAPAAGLNAAGWLFLLTAWGGIIAVTVFCFYKIFKTRDRSR